MCVCVCDGLCVWWCNSRWCNGLHWVTVSSCCKEQVTHLQMCPPLFSYLLQRSSFLVSMTLTTLYLTPFTTRSDVRYLLGRHTLVVVLCVHSLTMLILTENCLQTVWPACLYIGRLWSCCCSHRNKWSVCVGQLAVFMKLAAWKEKYSLDVERKTVKVELLMIYNVLLRQWSGELDYKHQLATTCFSFVYMHMCLHV